MMSRHRQFGDGAMSGSTTGMTDNDSKAFRAPVHDALLWRRFLPMAAPGEDGMLFSHSSEGKDHRDWTCNPNKESAMQITMPRSAIAAGLFAAAGVVVAVMTTPAAAQTNPTYRNVVPQSETATIHAKITDINPDTRAVTLKGRSGREVTLTAGPAVRLEMLKIGDTVNAQYYRSVAFVVTPPKAGMGVPTPSHDEIAQIIAQPAEAPGGIGLQLTKISGTVVGIDMGAHSIDLVNPSGGGVYTIDVTDPARIAMLSELKVGDTITAVVSQMLAVSIEPSKSWF
jgi:Cu/Ag efflux protein CusF